MSVLIDVTQGDIDAAYAIRRERLADDEWEGPKLSESCPIALAAMRVLFADQVSTVCVDGDGWEIECWGEWVGCRRFSLPKVASDFIGAFDGAGASPVSFTVEEVE